MTKLYKYIFFILFLGKCLFAASLTDTFETSNDGWQYYQNPNYIASTTTLDPTSLSTKVLKLKAKAFNLKTYAFGPAYPNTTVTIHFNIYGSGKWDQTDKFYIYASGATTYSQIRTITEANGILDPAKQLDISFQVQTDNNGNVTLYLYPFSTKPAYLDDVIADIGKDPAYPDFNVTYQKTFKGDMYTIGNTILVTPDNQTNTICDTYTNGALKSPITKSNDKYYLCEYYADGNVSFPTTTATLSAPSSKAQVAWAGLYWQALVTTGTPINVPIKLKHSDMSTYTDIPADTLNQKKAATGSLAYTSYSAFADVTAYFRDNNLTSGTISVGKIPVVEGKIDNSGTYGAWTLVVIYEDKSSTLKNFSIYNGWQKVDQFNALVNIDIGGFHTPKNTTKGVLASLSVFASEGDRFIDADTLRVKPSKQTNFTNLLNNFDSTIDVNTTRTPAPANNQGIDIRSFELGTTGKDVIASEETNMTLQFTSSPTTDASGNAAQDAYWPSMIAFAVELYAPKICYDYTVSIGDTISVRSNLVQRDINTSTFGGTQPLKIQFLIHSYEADFTYTHSRAYITFTGGDAARLIYNKDYTEMSPANKNSYYKLINSHPELEENATLGQVALGENVITPRDVTLPWGILTPINTTYAILGYDINDTTINTISTNFDFHFDAQIQFNPGETPVDYSFSTADDNIPHCETNASYDPIHFGLNIERVNTTNEDPEKRYTLTTQITGRPYSIDIVTYTPGTLTTIAKQQPIDTTVELELINGDTFLNSSNAGYDTTCQNPKPIGGGKLIYLDPNNQIHKGRHTVTIPTDTQGSIGNTQAMHNAAFRLWVLAKKDSNGQKSAILHKCNNNTNNNSCFMDLYDKEIFADANQSHNCDADCHTPSTRKNDKCYTCLKDYYATAICSWDNFSIRPESFFITLKDDNDYNTSVSPQKLIDNDAATSISLAAGYQYLIEVNTTNFGDNSHATGYYSDRFYKQDYPFGTVPAVLNPGTLAIPAFSASNPATCNDRNSTSLPLHFSEGALVGSAHVRFNNVGLYELWFGDSTWTEVDQKSYIYKPIFAGKKVSDCKANSDSSSNAQRDSTGCTFDSTFGSKQKIQLNIQPYYFDINSSTSRIVYVKHPNNGKDYMYLNDLNNSYYTSGYLMDMTIAFEGNLTARGKNDIRLTNFTNGCKATDVTLELSRTTIPDERTQLKDSAGNLLQFQQFLQINNTTSAYVDTAIGIDQNITLPKAAFLDATTPGKTTLYLNTTFQKPLNAPVNPFRVTYKNLYVKGPASLDSKANMGTHTPDGNTSYDKNITYYYAKVTPQRLLYANISDNYKLTPLYVDIYCDSNASCSTFNLTQGSQSPDETSEWHDASNIFDNLNDGTTNLVVSNNSRPTATPTIAPNNNVAFTTGPASRSDINVSLQGAKPTTITVQIQPVPWLRYHPTNPLGYPNYQVEFTDSGWAGVGTTGQVVETTSSTETVQRTNW